MKPNIVDFAYQIIELHEENQRLRRDVEHYKQFEQMYFDQLDSSIKSNETMIGSILVAALDPDSIINKGWAAIEAENKAKVSA